jgi:uncharacterized protein
MNAIARRLLVALAIAACLLPASSSAASFDCAKAAIVVEKLICESATLGRLDEELSLLYRRQQGLPGQDAKSLRDSQRQWLAQQRNQCATVKCVALELFQRSSQLRIELEKRGQELSSIPETETSWQGVEKLLAQEGPGSQLSSPSPTPTTSRLTTEVLSAAPATVAVPQSPAPAQERQGVAVDCTQAFLPHERLICGSAVLRKLDEEVTQLLGRELSSRRDPRDKETILNRHDGWIQRDRSGCKDVKCNGLVMQDWAKTLRSYLTRYRLTSDDIPKSFPDEQAVERALAQEALDAASRPVQQTTAVASVTYRRPSNPSNSVLCTEAPFTESRFLLCDSKSGGSILDAMKRNAESATSAWERLKPSVRPKSSAAMLAPLMRFLDQASTLCPDMGYVCLDSAANRANRELAAFVQELRAKPPIAEEDGAKQERERIAALPVYVHARLGNTGRAGEVALRVENRTKKAFNRVDVACTLHEYYPEPVEQTELRWSVKANIAPESWHYIETVPVPWDDVKWYRKGVRDISCRTLLTIEATAQEAKLAIEANERTKEALSKKVAAAQDAMAAESDRRQAEASMDQAERLTTALQQANRGSAQCQAMARAFVPQLHTVRQYQSVRASAVGVVDAVIANLQRGGCVR